MPMVVAGGGGLGRELFVGFAGRARAEGSFAGRFAIGLVCFAGFPTGLARFFTGAFAVTFAFGFVAALVLRGAGLMTLSPSCP